MTPPTIAAAMIQQAESAGVAERRFDDGLRVRLRIRDNVCILDLMRRSAYPDRNEADRWRRAFRVGNDAWAYRGPVEDYYLISYEYVRRLL